jgi:hypothetical protein
MGKPTYLFSQVKFTKNLLLYQLNFKLESSRSTLHTIGSGKGISPLPSHRTGREPLDSSGSPCSQSLDQR